MKIFLIRHGITLAHEENKRQVDHDSLSEQGKSQAENASKFLHDKNISLAISSTSLRSIETAAIIKKGINLSNEVLISELFKEAKRPSEIAGKDKNDPEIKKILALLKQNASNPDWRYSDEETFLELLNRAKKALEYLKSQNAENIAVVTHGTFGKVFLSYLLFQDTLTYDIFETIRTSIRMSYVGIIEVSEEKGNWVIESVKNRD